MSANRQGKRPRSVALRALLLAAVMWTSGHGQGLPPWVASRVASPPRGPIGQIQRPACRAGRASRSPPPRVHEARG